MLESQQYGLAAAGGALHGIVTRGARVSAALKGAVTHKNACIVFFKFYFSVVS